MILIGISIVNSIECMVVANDPTVKVRNHRREGRKSDLIAYFYRVVLIIPSQVNLSWIEGKTLTFFF